MHDKKYGNFLKINFTTNVVVAYMQILHATYAILT